MEESHKVPEEYKKQFNLGYTMRKHNPDFLKGVRVPNNSAFEHGIKEHEKELVRDQFRGSSKQQTRGRNKGR